MNKGIFAGLIWFLLAISICIGAQEEPVKDNTKEEAKEETELEEQIKDKIIDTNMLITTNLEQVEISKFLKQLAINRKLNIVYSENIKGSISINLYNVTLEQALDAVLRVYDYSYEILNGVYYIYTKEEKELRDKKEELKIAKLYALNYLDFTSEKNVQILEETIRSILVAEANESFKILPEAHQVLLNAPKKKHEQIEILLKALDKAPQQIMVEVLIVDAILNEDLNIGFDFRYLDEMTFGQVTSGRLTDNGLDFEAIEFSPSRVDSTEDALSPALVDPPFGYVKGGEGVKFGYVKNHAATFIDALEAITDVRVLASPKILSIEGKEANMIIGKKIGYRTSVTTNTSTTETIEFLNVGTQLRFTCQVIGSEINMDIHPSQSQGALNAALLPEETTTEMNTTIRMKDGQSFIIGGLIDERTQTVNKQIPILGSIPFIGNLFKKKAEQVSKRELFVMITPYLISNHPDQVTPDQSADDIKMATTMKRHMIGTHAGRRTSKFKKAQKYYLEGEYQKCLDIVQPLKAKYPADASVKILEKMALRGIEEKEKVSKQNEEKNKNADDTKQK